METPYLARPYKKHRNGFQTPCLRVEGNKSNRLISIYFQQKRWTHSRHYAFCPPLRHLTVCNKSPEQKDGNRIYSYR